ncbi:hypothetical protein PIB30_073144 [Stylosanthes scabra]|uniref:Uncharacterized protein n=1 Tax=Stylosanthes scabra TaxID=79078 RepID=A0ABU6SQH1_9FABA|nr:hypothetical protein [Stylosanthes scabra]
MVDASIVSVAGIAENVLVKGSSSSTTTKPSLTLWGKSLKCYPSTNTSEEKCASFPSLQRGSSENQCHEESQGKRRGMSERRKQAEKGVGSCSPSYEEERKERGFETDKEKKKHEEVKSRKKKKRKEDEVEEMITSKYSSLGNSLGKLKKIRKALRHNQIMDSHLVKDQSKWK